jgi:hypothetical protein
MSERSAIGQLRLEVDVSPAEWAVAGVRDFEYDVGSLVPTSFAAYARVFHPAYLTLEQREIRWAEVAAANGRRAHPAMEWIAITGSWRFLHHDTQPGIWDQEPSEGSLPLRQSIRVTSILSDHTTTAERCWFAIWDGFADLDPPPSDAPKVQMPNRPMWLFSGAIHGWEARQQNDLPERSPSLWWPEDHSWCVATDVDLMTTYVGGSDACIEALVAVRGLEAMRVSVDQDITCNADTVNPSPSSAEGAGGTP